MIKLLGYLLVSCSIAFLGFSIYRATDAILPELQMANAEIKAVRNDIQEIKSDIPGLAKTVGTAAAMGTLEQTRDEGQKMMDRVMSPDPRKHLDPFGMFD
jgi:hypothetical protein